MNCKIKTLPKSEVEFAITVDTAELAPLMQKAAARLSEKAKMEGFRPGKAPYEIVKARFGEAAILEEAAEDTVRKYYFEAVKANNLETVGQPKIEVVKIAPGNPFEFKATAAVMPEIKLGAYKNLGIKKQETKIENEKVENALSELQKMQSKEALTDKAAAEKDKIIADVEMSKDGVSVEGGSAKNMAVYLSENHYIAGFNKELIGLKKGDEKIFSLKFPETHYQKNLAGANVDFKVKVADVYEITPPELNDDFAKSLGQKSLDGLRALIRKNMEIEAAAKDEEKFEISILSKIVENTRFGDIPEILINDEAHKMVHELEHNVASQGGNFEDYLKTVKKTERDLMLDMAPEAAKRIKIALAVREIGKLENISADDAEVIAEIEKLMNAYKNDSETQKQIRQPEYADYIRTRIINRKAIEFIKKNN